MPSTGAPTQAEQMQTEYAKHSTQATTRMNFRVRPEVHDRLTAAAQAVDLSLTDFVVSAATVRADEILSTHLVVPGDYFDQLVAALDTLSSTPNNALRRAAHRQRANVEQR